MMLGYIRKAKIADAISRARSSEREKVEREAARNLREVTDGLQAQHEFEMQEKDAEVEALHRTLDSRDKQMADAREAYLKAYRVTRKIRKVASDMAARTHALLELKVDVAKAYKELEQQAEQIEREMLEDDRDHRRKLQAVF